MRASAEPTATQPAAQPPGELALPDPARVQRTSHAVSGRQVHWYRGPEPLLRPLGLRAAAGVSWSPTLNEVGFSLDTMATARLGLTPGYWHWALWPELGYTHDLVPAAGRHLGSLGLGPALQSESFSLGVIPRLVLGSAGGALAVGLRTGLLVELWENLLCVELSHQWLSSKDRSGHDLSVKLSVDLLMLAFVIVSGHDPMHYP